MALPVPEKTWQRSKNQGPYNSRGEVLYAWKTLLTTVASGAWTVVRSCGRVGGVTWTAGASDYWDGPSAIVGDAPGSSHSWIVLAQTALGANWQLCIDHVDHLGGLPSVMKMYVSSAAGFTGGTTTARPTATDEVDLSSGIAPEWCGTLPAYTGPWRLNTFISTDGECTRWLIWTANLPTAFIAIDKPKDPVSGWTDPWVVIRTGSHYNDGGPTSFATYALLFQATANTVVGMPGAAANAYLTSESIGNTTTGAVGQQQTYGGDLDSGAYPLMPMGLFCVTSGMRGRLGAIYDLWWGSTTPNDGDDYPNDASRQFVQVNDLVIEWGGGAQMIRA